MGFFRRLLGKPTIEEFGDQFVRALRKAAPIEEFRHESVDQRIIRISDGKENGITNPGNFYQTHLALPRRQRADHLRHCVRVALTTDRELPSDFSEARLKLRSRLWSRAGLEQMRLKNLYTEGDQGGFDLPSQPIGEHLLACLAYDWAETVQAINDDNLREWGVTTYEALEAASRRSSPSGRRTTTSRCRQRLTGAASSSSTLSVVLSTASGLSEMLSIPCSTRKRANSG